MVMCALVAVRAEGSALSDAAAGLQPGQWTVVNTQNFNKALLDDGAGYHVFYYTEDLTWDPVSRQLLFVGGGHGTDAEFLRYSESTNTWSRTKPSGNFWHSSFSHAYDHDAIIPSLGKFFFRQPAYDPSDHIEIYDIASGSWSRSAAMPYRPGCCGGLEYFPELNGLVLANGDSGLLFYDPTANRWSEISSAHWGDYHNFAEYSPVHKTMVFGGGESSGTNAMIRLNANRSITRLQNAPGHLGQTHSIVTTDPVSGNHLVFFDNGWYEFNPAADTWKRMSGSPAFGGVWGTVATPISTYGVVAFAKYNGDSSKVYLYRHSAGGGTTPPPPALPTVSLTANPTTVPAGSKSTLTWNATNANACTASGAWSGTKATSGTEERTLTATSTFTLSCSNTQGQSASRSINVTVAPVSPAPTLSFRAWPVTVARGDTTSLIWSAQNATGCVASGAWAGNKAATGEQISPAVQASTTFNLDCTGPGGTIARSINVNVDAAKTARPVVTMSLQPYTVALTPQYCSSRGMPLASCTASTVVRWSATNATSCVASGGWTGTKATSGQATLAGFSADKVFSLQCSGPGGSRSGSVLLRVLHP